MVAVETELHKFKSQLERKINGTWWWTEKESEGGRVRDDPSFPVCTFKRTLMLS